MPAWSEMEMSKTLECGLEECAEKWLSVLRFGFWDLVALVHVCPSRLAPFFGKFQGYLVTVGFHSLLRQEMTQLTDSAAETQYFRPFSKHLWVCLSCEPGLSWKWAKFWSVGILALWILTVDYGKKCAKHFPWLCIFDMRYLSCWLKTFVLLFFSAEALFVSILISSHLYITNFYDVLYDM